MPFTDNDIEAAVDFLRESARDLGLARYNMIKAEKMTKHAKAMAMKLSSETAISAQEREAYASAQYVEAIETEAVAAQQFEELRARREAAGATIEAWRTMSATLRANTI